MAKKRNRRSRRSRQTQQPQAGGSQRKRRINTPSLIFIGLIVLMAVFVAVASLLGDRAPSCPPGQVWSDAHGHCH